MKKLKNKLAVLSLCGVSASCWAPDAGSVSALRDIESAVAPEYRAYVDQDDGLTDEAKLRRAHTLQAWDRLLKEMEENVNR